MCVRKDEWVRQREEKGVMVQVPALHNHQQEVHHYTLSAHLLFSAPPSLSTAASLTSWRSPVAKLAPLLLDIHTRTRTAILCRAHTHTPTTGREVHYTSHRRAITSLGSHQSEWLLILPYILYFNKELKCISSFPVFLPSEAPVSIRRWGHTPVNVGVCCMFHLLNVWYNVF